MRRQTLNKRAALQALATLDAAWQSQRVFALFVTTWADAKHSGYTGAPADLYAQFLDRVRQARELAADMRDVEHEYSPTALLAEIRRLGGLRPFTRDFDGHRLRGDFAAVVEGFAAGSTWGQRGGASIFRTNGLALDDLLLQLQQEPRWAFIQDDNHLIDMLDQIARDGPSATDDDLAHYLRATGIEAGAQWWTERLTEAAPRPNGPQRVQSDGTERTCTKCHVAKPSRDYLWGDAGRTMRNVCLDCRKAQQREARARKRAA